MNQPSPSASRNWLARASGGEGRASRDPERKAWPMSVTSGPVIRHRINVEWFRDWNAPHHPVSHPDAWRRPSRSDLSRDVPTGARQALRDACASVVFATPDAGVDPATEPLPTILVRAVMAARHHTQPVVTFPNAAAPNRAGDSFSGTDCRIVDGEAGRLKRAARRHAAATESRLAPSDVSWLTTSRSSCSVTAEYAREALAVGQDARIIASGGTALLLAGATPAARLATCGRVWRPRPR
jgi:hypothetical protein